MSWFDKVPPKIRALVGKTNVPDNLWHQCSACAQMIFHRELDANLMVCPNCGHHMRFPAAKRLAAIFDKGLYETVPVPPVPVDPLKFRDRKRYSDRLKEARATNGATDAIVVATGQILGHEAVVAVFDFQFMGGSMGIAVGEGFVTAADTAVARNVPLIVFPSSGGARMQEGILSLMQMPRTVIAVQKVREAGLPYIVVLTDPTTGGVSASFAMLGDIAIAEPGAVIGFAGARVIEETIREQLPKGFQRAEYLLEHGMIDMVVPRQQLPKTLARIIDLLLNPAARAGDVAPVKDTHLSGSGSGNAAE
jgi:acetyl-CoA carboxylase carboxyl transferase subunit beta